MSSYIGYCGKLPSFEDFVRSPTSTISADLFQQWLDTASAPLMQSLVESRGSFNSLSPLGLVIRLPEAPALITGLCVPSSDKAGRKSPFVIFAEFSADTFGSNMALIPECSNLFLQVALRCLDNSGQCFGFDRIRDTMWTLDQGLRTDLSEAQARYASYLAKTTVQELLSALDVGDAREKIIPNTVRSLLSARESVGGQLQAVFRFPLSTGPQRTMEMAYWIQLSEAALGRPLECQALLWGHKHLDIAFQVPLDCLLALSWNADAAGWNIWEFRSMDFESDQIEEAPAIGLDSIWAGDDIRIQDLIARTASIQTG